MRSPIPQNKSSEPWRNPWLGALVAAILLIVLYKACGGRPKRVAEVPQEAKTQPQYTISSQPVDVQTEPLNKASEVRKARKYLFQRNQLGLKELKLQNVNGRYKIPVVFRPDKLWCEGGDIDTIKYGVTKLTSKEVLISLETMSGNKTKENFYVSVDDLYKGLTHVYDVPAGKVATLSMSICTDKKHSGSCRGKPVVSAMQLANSLAANQHAQPKDYLFYFQHLLLGKTSILAYRTDNFTPKFKTLLGDYLSKGGLKQKEIDFAWKTNRTIRSNPVDVADSKIILSLTYNDKKCGSIGHH